MLCLMRILYCLSPCIYVLSGTKDSRRISHGTRESHTGRGTARRQYKEALAYRKRYYRPAALPPVLSLVVPCGYRGFTVVGTVLPPRYYRVHNGTTALPV